MALEYAGFALGVIPELRNLKNRISNYLQGPAAFQALQAMWADIRSRSTQVERNLSAREEAVPPEYLPLFRDRLESVQECLEECKLILDELSQQAFPAIRMGRRGAFAVVCRRLTKATLIRERLFAQEEKLRNASCTLDTLTSDLSTLVAVKNASAHVLRDGINAEKYVPMGNTPAPSHRIRLFFNAKDATGLPATPEGKLKHAVLASTSAHPVTSAIGARSPACGVVGMAGVGKTIALQGLAGDEDIRKRFVHGILYISLGLGASEQKAILRIANIMRNTGASASVGAVLNAPCLQDAVDYAGSMARNACF